LKAPRRTIVGESAHESEGEKKTNTKKSIRQNEKRSQIYLYVVRSIVLARTALGILKSGEMYIFLNRFMRHVFFIWKIIAAPAIKSQLK
jgi:hypothetical protein